MASENQDSESRLSNISSSDELQAIHRKEKKDLIAKTQKMKHGVPKGDKKKKKEVTAEITQLLADLDLKHEAEMNEFLTAQDTAEETKEKSPSANSLNRDKNGHSHEGVTNQSEETSESPVTTSDATVSNQRVSKPQKNGVGVTNQSDETNKSPVTNSDAPVPTQRVSKAQKRRNKKAALEKERNKAIAEQEVENLSGLRHLESESIRKKLSERNLTIYEIPSDGNCLYKAIEHQLSILNLPEKTVQTLREETSKYMLSHSEDYMPFLTCPETGDVLNEEMYEKYCEDIVKTPAWGGHIEIQVLSHILGLPIEIMQAEGSNIIIGDEKSKPKLTLCYHRHVFGLGEHYNSVIPLAE